MCEFVMQSTWERQRDVCFKHKSPRRHKALPHW